MMKQALEKRILIATFLLALGCLFMVPAMIGAQQLTHKVEKGDTLWDICEKYYGDPDLWPKLWQMNPFVTNPHFLKPGDAIVLLEKEPLKEETAPVAEETEPEVTTTSAPAVTGIDVSGLANVKTLGFLSSKKVKSWGHIFATDTCKVMLSKGDTVFVDFGDREDIEPGAEFTIVKSSSSLRHPLTSRKLGYAHSIRGKIVIKKYLRKGRYRAEIPEAYRSIGFDDSLIPYEPISSCVQAIPVDGELIGNIVAVKDQQEFIGQYSIVYLDRGFNHGIRRGNVFEAVRIKKIYDPELNSVADTVKEFFKASSGAEIYKKLTRKTHLFDIPLGKIMILESRPDTATALVLSSKENFPTGTFIKGLSWVETPDFLSAKPSCPIE